MPQLPSVSELMVGAHLRDPPLQPHQDSKHSAASPRLTVAADALLRHAPLQPIRAVDVSESRVAPPFYHTSHAPHHGPHGNLTRYLSHPAPATPMPQAPTGMSYYSNTSQGDYFSYRRPSAQAPPHYYLHPSSVSLLLLESQLRMTHGATSVSRIDPPSPAANSPLHQSLPGGLRPSLFSNTGGAMPYGHVGQVLVTPSYNLYAGPPPQTVRVNSGLIGPYSYGLPPLTQAVPYGVLVGTQYGPVMMGPGPTPGPAAELQLSHSPPEQNNALLNKRRNIKRRTRTGCLTCRKRRIKCDERKPHCFNCERSKKLCLGYEVLPSAAKRRNLEEEPKRRLSLVYDLL